MKKFIISIATSVLIALCAVAFVHAGFDGDSYSYSSGGSSYGSSTPCTMDRFTADAYTVKKGYGTTVTWSTTGCFSVSVAPADRADNRPPDGSTNTGAIFRTTTYTATGWDEDGYPGTSRTLTITVEDVPTQSCVVNSFTADQYSVSSGSGTNLNWSTTGCDHVSITPGSSNRSANGSASTGVLYNTTSYTLTGYDSSGNTGGSRSLTISVNSQPTLYQCNDGIDNDGDGYTDYPSDSGCTSPSDNSEYNSSSQSCYINDFSADDLSVEKGDRVRLEWSTTGCDYVRVTSLSGNLDPDDSATVYPSSTKTYTLTAYPNGGTEKITIRVNDEDDNNDYCSVDSFYVDSYSIDRGSSTTLRWQTSGATDVDITPSLSNRSSDGSVTIRPTVTTTYTIRLSGNGCSDSQSITVTVGGATTNSRPQAITTAATALGISSAQLNGIAVPNTPTGNTTAWFEWGPGTTLSYRTTTKNIPSNNSSNYYSDVATGMTPGVSYYYRAVVQNQNGIAYGDIVRIPLVANVVQGSTTVVTRAPTVVTRSTSQSSIAVGNSAPSLLELRVESLYDRMCVGGDMDYTVTYRNISNEQLENTVLRVSMPKELTYIGSSSGHYDSVDKVVTVDLGTMNPGEQGTLTVRAHVNEKAVQGNLAVMTATVVYTNTSTHAQEDAIAYSLITVSNDCPNLLGASVFGFGSFLPDTLLEWLLLILVILALILLGRNLYKKKETTTTVVK